MITNRTVYWVVANTAFLAALWFGFTQGVEGARHVATLYLWLSFVGSFAALSDPIREAMRGKGPAVPAPLDIAVDVAIVAFLAWHGHMWMAAAYAFHTIAIHGAYASEAKQSGRAA